MAGFIKFRAMKGELLEDGDAIMLVDSRGRRYLKRLRAGHPLTVRGTLLNADDIIGRSEGCLAGRDQPERFRVFRPSYAELTPLLSRPAEPIFAKDVGLILCRGDIRPGQTVVEVGVGAGLTSMALLRGVGEKGRLVSYELREDFAAEARANVELYEGPVDNWTIHLADARHGINERSVDRVFADIPDAAALIQPVAQALRGGGIFISYAPTVLQIKDLRDALEASNTCRLAETFEVLERSWHVQGRSVRPDHRMVAHTGFITVARRLSH